MKYFPIVPIKYLDDLASLSRNQIVLAQWLEDKKYLNFYKKCRRRGDFILLDNGACELGRSIPIRNLIECYEILGGCDVLVIPDSQVGNNRSVVEEAIEVLADVGIDGITGDTKLMGVPQSLEDLEWMIKQPYISILGISRTIAWDEGFGDRVGLIEAFKDCGRQFHLLGMRRNPTEEVMSVRLFGDLILGVDSSFPFRLFSRGRRIGEHRPYPEHDSMYKNDLSSETLKFCIEEMEAFIDWVGGKEAQE